MPQPRPSAQRERDAGLAAATTAYKREKGQPGVTAASICDRIAEECNLSPNSKPKPRTVKEHVRESKVGQGLGQRGRVS